MSVRFGVIGTGAWGSKVISTVRKLGFDYRVCNRSGKFEGHPCNTHYEETVKNSDIVFICTHPPTTYEIAKFSLDNKRVTIAEKPVSLYLSDVRELRDLSKANSTSFIVDYIHLFNHGLHCHDTYKLGSLKTITMEGSGPIREYSALRDYGSHAVAVALDQAHCAVTNIQASLIGPSEREVYLINLTFDSYIIRIQVSNKAAERCVKFDFDQGSFKDERQYSPLSCLISKAARNFLRNEYWTNGDLAVEVTDVLQRIERLVQCG